ncbi:MAG TPA: TIGR03435 family protein [Bryobacteraceae bacterium]|jgi:uncharacterized protein (TIGR03435 family)
MRRLLLLATLPLLAQSPDPKFEVASVKPNVINDPMDYRGGAGAVLSGRNIPALGWIQIAYGVKDFQIAGPAWISSEKFDIDAKPAQPASAPQMLAMLKSLLADRFHLTLHHETKQLPVYDLVVARRGLKMKPSKDQSPWAGDFPNGSPDGRPTTGGGPSELAPGRLAGKAVPMTIIVNLLAGPLGRPVVNKTGLTGRFDLDLRYTPGSGQAPSGDTAPDDDPRTASLFTSLQEQLGLKLEPSKGPVDVLVIDHIERPSAN